MHRRDWLRAVALSLLTACRLEDGLVPRPKAKAGLLTTGPWKGVYDTPDPFDASPSHLRDLLNGYIPDPDAGSGVYARNGFGKAFNGNPLTTAFSALYGQAVYEHTMLDGSILNFVIIAGKLLRLTAPNATATTVTDVTPVGVSINSGVGPVYITSMVAEIGGVTQSVIVVNDQLNRPWYGTNLTGTPITGTYIDYDGAGVAWTAVGQPVVWQGALLFILGAVGGVARREDIAWSEPGSPDTGYQQATFDNNMTLVLPGQSSPGALFALSPTNVALYYFRSHSIGAIAGPIDNLASSNTADAVSFNIGCTAPRTIQQFGNAHFFCDALGRPYLFRPGSPPEPIWHQMRGVVREWGANAAYQLATYASSAIEPTHNLYLVTIRRDDPGAADTVAPTIIYAFDAATGTYVGRWTIADLNDGNGGIGISCMGILEGLDGNDPVLFVVGQGAPTSAALGYGWYFRARGFPFPDDAQWFDGDVYPNVQVTTDRLGEDPDTVYFVDRLTAITGNAAPCAFSVETSASAFAAVASAQVATPIGSPADETYRCAVGVEQRGRGPAVRVWPQPSDATIDQWALHRMTLRAVPSLAQPDEV